MEVYEGIDAGLARNAGSVSDVSGILESKLSIPETVVRFWILEVVVDMGVEGVSILPLELDGSSGLDLSDAKLDEDEVVVGNGGGGMPLPD
jgi:hypothetical protein